MPTVARWAVLSSAAAPVLLIGGWTLGATRQPAAFDSTVDTISALAAYGAANRWIMTVGLGGLGVCHVVTALGLRPAALPGRIVLAAGGVATVLVAAFPQPEGGSSAAHVAAAAVAFPALSVWPALASRRGRPGVLRPGVLRPAVGVTVSAGLLGLLGWFFWELSGDGALVGLTERLLAGSQALWPLVVVSTLRASPPVPPGKGIAGSNDDESRIKPTL